MMFMMIETEFNREYRERDEFRDLLMEVIIERSVSHEVTIGTIKRALYALFVDSNTRGGIYRFLRYTVLPILQKDRAKMEEKKQRRLELLAEMFDEDGRSTEAHVVRAIVKPTIAELNTRWASVSTLSKLGTMDRIRWDVTKDIRNDKFKLPLLIKIKENDRLIEETMRVIEDCNRRREEIEVNNEESLKTIDETLSETLKRRDELVKRSWLLSWKFEDWLWVLGDNVRFVFGN